MKKIISIIRLKIQAKKATPTPPIGPALGQKGLNIINFCKEFNYKTKNYDSNFIIPVLIKIYDDKSYKFKIKSPTVTFFIKKILKIKKINSKLKNIYINNNQIKEIVLNKYKDLNTTNIKNATKIIIGSIKSMGIKII